MKGIAEEFFAGCIKRPHLDQRGHWVHFMQVLQDAFHQVGHRHTDGPGSVALQPDHLVGPAVHTQHKNTLKRKRKVSFGI